MSEIQATCDTSDDTFLLRNICKISGRSIRIISGTKHEKLFTVKNVDGVLHFGVVPDEIDAVFADWLEVVGKSKE